MLRLNTALFYGGILLGFFLSGCSDDLGCRWFGDCEEKPPKDGYTELSNTGFKYAGFSPDSVPEGYELKVEVTGGVAKLENVGPDIPVLIVGQVSDNEIVKVLIDGNYKNRKARLTLSDPKKSVSLSLTVDKLDEAGGVNGPGEKDDKNPAGTFK